MRFEHAGKTYRLGFRRQRVPYQWRWKQWLAKQKGLEQRDKLTLRLVAEAIGPVAHPPIGETLRTKAVLVDDRGLPVAMVEVTCVPEDFPATVEKGRQAAVDKLAQELNTRSLPPGLGNAVRAAYFNRRKRVSPSPAGVS